MPDSLRDLWSGYITADDYERHMASTGQPQANADLLGELFRDHAPPPGSRILFAAAGTGQYFQHWDSGELSAYRCVFTDINPRYLALLAERSAGEVMVDDIEDPQVAGPFELAIVVLALEHVDWRSAVTGLCRLTSRVFTVIQENPADVVARPLEGTMAALREHSPHLIDRAELIEQFARCQFVLTRVSFREVLDGKRMVGLDFTASTRVSTRPQECSLALG